MLRRATLAAILAFPIGEARAEHLTFAIPEDHGRISLAVFNAADRPVRILNQLAPLTDFRIDLNGLSIEWDLRDGQGQPLPPGEYRLGGWFVPDTIEVAGTAVHFNDWVDTNGEAPLREILGVFPGEGDSFWVVGKTGAADTTVAWSVDPTGRLGEARELPGRFLGGELAGPLCLNEAGEVIGPGAEGQTLFEGRKILAAASGSVFPVVIEELPDGATRAVFRRPTEVVETPPTPEPAQFAAGGIEMVFAGSSNRLWAFREKDWQEIPLGDPLTVSSIAAGPEETVWVSVTLDGDPPRRTVRQYALDGTLLRELETLAPASLSADPNRLRLFFVLHHAGETRVRGLQPFPGDPSAPQPDTVSTEADWDLFLDQAISPAGAKTFWEQNAVSAGADREGAISVNLLPNPFNPAPRPVSLRLKQAEGVVWIEDSAGLQVAEICRMPGVDRTHLSLGLHPGEARAFVGTPTGVAEFVVTGLDRLVRLDPGHFTVTE